MEGVRNAPDGSKVGPKKSRDVPPITRNVRYRASLQLVACHRFVVSMLLLVYLAATTAHDPAAAPPETRVILAPRPRCAVVLDRHVQKSAGSTMRSIFLENALAGACL